LISSDTVALSELVKNSYDADATRVLIRIDPHQDQIEVLDDGIGMSLETIQTVWLEPATPSKLSLQRSRGRRRFLGAKGIGRFASSRLARELQVYSKTVQGQEEAWATFDWTKFDNPDTYLDEVEIPSGSRVPTEICANGAIDSLWDLTDRAGVLRHGTILRMSGLKQPWTEAAVRDLKRTLSRLLSPQQKRADSFQIRLKVIGLGDQETSEDIQPPDLIKYPHYRVTGVVRKDGRYRIRYTVAATGDRVTKKGVFERQATRPFELVARESPHPNEETRSIESGPLRFDFRIWDRDDLGNIVQRTGFSISDIREDLDAIAGVSIYRDDFRVLPYGEPNNDWLRLDIRRVQKPTMRLSNNQLHGYIGISADTNPELKDQSNREGLVAGSALSDLSDIVVQVLATLEVLRYNSRPRNVAVKRDPQSLSEMLSLAKLRDSLGDVANEPDVRAALEVADKQIASGLKEVQEVLGRYHRLATLGQLIDVVLHDGRQPVASITNQAELGIEAIARPKLDPQKELAPRFVSIKLQASNLSTLFKRIEPFGGRRRGRPKQLFIEDIIRNAFEVFSHEIERLGVSLSLPESETLVRVDSTELQEVVVNLLQNSLYWLRQVPKEDRKIAVQLERTKEGHLQMTFADSGPGVPTEHRESIFEPYFSTKPDGVGLGLTISGQIASDYYDGSLELLETGVLPGASFRLTLKKRV